MAFIKIRLRHGVAVLLGWLLLGACSPAWATNFCFKITDRVTGPHLWNVTRNVHACGMLPWTIPQGSAAQQLCLAHFKDCRCDASRSCFLSFCQGDLHSCQARLLGIVDAQQTYSQGPSEAIMVY